MILIRKAVPEDYHVLGTIWLRASIKAHHFVARELWESYISTIREKYLPASETWVIEEDGYTSGFLCLRDDVVAALFIDPQRQGRGHGSSLMEKAKELRSRLELSVYTENPGAIAFYKQHGFSIVEERKDVNTAHNEFVMKWEG